jgi:hypothetical protein
MQSIAAAPSLPHQFSLLRFEAAMVEGIVLRIGSIVLLRIRWRRLHGLGRSGRHLDTLPLFLRSLWGSVDFTIASPTWVLYTAQNPMFSMFTCTTWQRPSSKLISSLRVAMREWFFVRNSFQVVTCSEIWGFSVFVNL